VSIGKCFTWLPIHLHFLIVHKCGFGNSAAKTKQLRELMEKQILLMDGAMGSLIQEYKLTEEEFRGTATRFLAISFQNATLLLAIAGS
jgi:hypothetical protein